MYTAVLWRQRCRGRRACVRSWQRTGGKPGNVSICPSNTISRDPAANDADSIAGLIDEGVVIGTFDASTQERYSAASASLTRWAGDRDQIAQQLLRAAVRPATHQLAQYLIDSGDYGRQLLLRLIIRGGNKRSVFNPAGKASTPCILAAPSVQASPVHATPDRSSVHGLELRAHPSSSMQSTHLMHQAPLSRARCARFSSRIA